MNSLSKTVIRQRRGCDLNPGPSAPESSTLTTRLPSHPLCVYLVTNWSLVASGGGRPAAGPRDTAISADTTGYRYCIASDTLHLLSRSDAGSSVRRSVVLGSRCRYGS